MGRLASQVLLEPLSDLLHDADPTARSELLIVPHRHLFAVPWSALPDRSGRRLVEHRAVRVAPSLAAARLAAAAAAKPTRAAVAAVVGDPAAAGGAGGGLPPLPFARGEAVWVARLLSRRALSDAGGGGCGGGTGVKAVIGSEAKRGRVMGMLAGASWAHLACHGLLDRRALALSPDEGEAVMGCGDSDAGLLSMEDVQGGGRLAGGATAVLSACCTARGDVTAAEGVVGLARAFLAAGAGAAVVSLWAVGDESTVRLMQAGRPPTHCADTHLCVTPPTHYTATHPCVTITPPETDTRT